MSKQKKKKDFVADPRPLPWGALPVDSSGDRVQLTIATVIPATLAGLRMHRSDDWHRVSVTTPEPILAAAAGLLAELIDEGAALQGATDLRSFAACMGDEDGDRFPTALRSALELETRMAEAPTVEDMVADPKTDWTLRERTIWEHMGELIRKDGRIKELQNLLYQHGIKYD